MQLTKHWAAQLDDYVIDLAWAPDGTSLAAASAAGPVALYGSPDGVKRCAFPGHEGGSNSIAWQPGTALLASGGQDGAVKLWDTAAGQHVATAPLGRPWVEHLAWRPAGAAPILAAAAGRKLVFINPDATVRHAFQDAPKTISALAWHPLGSRAAVAYFGGVCLWGADDALAQSEFPYGNGIHALAWSPDGRWLVSGNQDPSVHIWMVESGVELQMSGYEGKVRHLSFDFGSRWLATSGGRDVCVWDCSGAGPEGREPVMLAHEAPVCGVAFQRTHGLLASASQDGALMLWSAERRQPLRATVRMPAAATCLAWSPDDSHLAIGSEKAMVYVLRCDP
ncbi:MAG TPA: WD40 repeat domain-containing protein [Opitutaceae bacterium]|nr:WD40 repeat domain-containing protein [Opitutaceae bacterium]